MVWGVLVAVAVCAGGAAVLVRQRSSRRLTQLLAVAEKPLAAYRGWRAVVDTHLAVAISERRWIARDQWHAWVETRPSLTPALEQLAKCRAAGQDAREVLTVWKQDLRSEVALANDRILASELVQRRTFFDTIEKQPLTNEQATAVATFDNRVQVIAAAGSGKTSVMVARAAYSILRGFVPAERILLLAFNKDAATELQERVEARLAAASIDPTGLRAATFHSFGLNVIGKATGRKPRLAPWLEAGGDIGMVSRIVDELRDRSFSFRFKWDLYRLLFARMADEPDGGEPDGYDYGTKQAGFRTFNGETVKSQGERMIADFLFLNGVTYQYEHPYPHDVADAEHSQYRPDFYYPDIDIWHEHWALDRDGQAPADFAGYAEGMAWKKSIHQQFGTSLIETTWAKIIDQSGFQPLATELKDRGLTLDWNPDRPIPGGTPIKHEDLARLMRSFMAHVKSNSLTPDELKHRLESAPKSVQKYRASLFLDLYWEIHNEWQLRLASDDSIDFEDMLVLAAEHLESGAVDMGFDHVLVDEFQDVSQARARLTRALIDRPNRYLLAVGDDWQSINRFAGADLAVMTDFNTWFGDGPTLRLQTTFRSPQAICDTASEFVSRNPRQLIKAVRSIHSDYGPTTSLVRVSRPDELPIALTKVLSDLATRVRAGEVEPNSDGSVDVDVLGRYHFERDMLPRNPPPELQLRFRTIHASKGLEADYVILPNVSSGTFGFPSEVVDDPVISLAMAEADPYPYAEERRLFYVALTRARRHVTLIGVQGRESAFVAELLANRRLELSPLSTADLAEHCPSCGQGVLVARRARASGRSFLACSAFPRCTFTRRA